MTIRDALDVLRRHSHDPAGSRLEAQWLLMHALGVETSHLYAYPEQELTAQQVAQVEAYAARLGQGEPVAYILEMVGFYGREFIVSPAVLIPRPETEHLIEAALAWAKEKSDLTIADIGTGSGIIPVTLAAHLPQAMVHAVDISEDALNIARQNANKHGVKITFHHGSLAEPLIANNVRVDLLCANLPYIPADEVPALKVSRYEPTLALDGGPDGLRLIEILLKSAPDVCHEKALILLEIGSGQGEAVKALAESLFAPQSVEIIYDYAGHDRVVKIKR
jgi:release factor glutamine methyltransferase